MLWTQSWRRPARRKPSSTGLPLPAPRARAPDIIEKLQREGVDPVGGTLADLATLIARASAMARARQGANIKLQ